MPHKKIFNFYVDLLGNIDAELTGGNFWQGAIAGGIVAGLNHVMHQLDPPKGFKGKEWKDKDGTFTRNEDGSYDVSNSPDKIGKYKEIKEVILTVKSKLRQNVDNVVAGLGINTSIKEGLLESVNLSSINKTLLID